MEPTPKRRPGELVFNIAVMLASFGLLYSAYGISGFEALSAPGAVPMATTAIMAVCAIIILVQTLRKGTGDGQTMAADILPLIVIVTIAMIAAWRGAAAACPASRTTLPVLFLLVMIRFLSRRG